MNNNIFMFYSRILLKVIGCRKIYVKMRFIISIILIIIKNRFIFHMGGGVSI